MKPRKTVDPTSKFSSLGLASDKQKFFEYETATSQQVLPEEGNSTPAKLVAIECIHPWQDQPRRYFSEKDIHALAEDFKNFGFHGAILVRSHSQKGQGHYLIVDGERSWRAAQLAGIKELPCIISDLDDELAMELAIVKNQLREDLTALELTESLIRLIAQKTQRLAQENPEIAPMNAEAVVNYMRTSMNPRNLQEGADNAVTRLVLDTVQAFNIEYSTFYAKYLRLLSLPAFLKQAHLEQNIPYMVILELEKLKPKGKNVTEAAINQARNEQQILLNHIIEQKLSHRDVIELIREKRAGKTTESSGAGAKIRASFLESVKKIDRPELWKDKELRQELERVLAELETLREKVEGKLSDRNS